MSRRQLLEIGPPLAAIDWFFQSYGGFPYAPWKSIIEPLTGDSGEVISDIHAVLRSPIQRLGYALGYVGACHVTETTEEMIESACELAESFRDLFDGAVSRVAGGTMRIRHGRPAAEVVPPADALREAAMAPGAPIELVYVARAVRDGRTSWQEIVEGRADHLPEMIGLHARSTLLTARARHAAARSAAEAERVLRSDP
jgi:hypothetical protein